MEPWMYSKRPSGVQLHHDGDLAGAPDPKRLKTSNELSVTRIKCRSGIHRASECKVTKWCTIPSIWARTMKKDTIQVRYYAKDVIVFEHHNDKILLH